MRVTRIIDAPVERVWEVLIDTELWPVWGPSLRGVKSPRRQLQAGLKGRLQTVFGLWLPFEITRFEPLRYWHWRVAGLPATGHRLRRLDAQRCELCFEIPYGAFYYAPVCRRALRAIARLALDNRPDHVHTLQTCTAKESPRAQGEEE